MTTISARWTSVLMRVSIRGRFSSRVRAAGTARRVRRGGRGNQFMQVPTNKRVDVVLLERRIRPGDIVRRDDAPLGLLAQLPILLGGHLPKRHDLFQSIIATFDGVLVDQPGDADRRAAATV